MAVWSCWILAGTGTRCRIHQSRASQTCSMGDIFRWVCWPCKNWDVFSLQELCTDPCNMGPCIIMLQHEVMVVDEWHNNGPQDLVTVSPCIQNTINKIHLCSSITYTCPSHNPTATMGHSIHNVDISKPLTHTTPYTLYSENRDSSVKRTPLQSARRPRMWAFTHSSQLRQWTAVRWVRWGLEHADELPWDGFWQFVQKFFGYANRLLQQLSGGWSQTILEVKMLDVEVLGWCGYTWSAVGCTAKFSVTPLRDGLW